MFRALVTLAAFAAAIIATTGMVAHAQCLGMSCYGSGPYGYHDRGSDYDAPPRHYRPYESQRPRYDSRNGSMDCACRGYAMRNGVCKPSR